jgi:hypothetical protein
MAKRTKRAKPLDASHPVAQKLVKGRTMETAGEMSAPDTLLKQASASSGKPTRAGMSIQTALTHRTLAVQDPWDADTHYVIDRQAKLEYGCRVLLEIDNWDDSVCYLPGRLDTKHPDKAKGLVVRIIGSSGKDYGPCRCCEHKRVLRVVSLCTSI